MRLIIKTVIVTLTLVVFWGSGRLIMAQEPHSGNMNPNTGSDSVFRKDEFLWGCGFSVEENKLSEQEEYISSTLAFTEAKKPKSFMNGSTGHETMRPIWRFAGN